MTEMLNDKKRIRKTREINPISRANLIPVQKGEIRNPRGMPKGTKHRSTILKHWIETSTTAEDTNGETVRVTTEDAIVLALINKAREGDVVAIREVMDSLYGKVDQRVLIEQTPQFQTAKDVLVHTWKESLKAQSIDPETLTDEDRTAIESFFGQFLVKDLNLWDEL
jgi:hypothetical protein